jgi:hypothetical protein
VDIIGPAVGISLFLLVYYMLVGFLVVFFATTFGYTPARANDLANWYWITNAVVLVVAGVLSDRLRVRKPFMMIGAVISLVGLGAFASATTNRHTSYHTFAFYFVLIAVGAAIAYVPWMAAFTQTIEKYNPAATATGLAVWGWIIRIIVTVSFAILPAALPATSTLVDRGPKVASIVARYPAEVKTLQTVDPATLALLHANPGDRSAQAKAVSELSGVPAASVARAAALGTRYAQQLQTLAALAPATQIALAVDPRSVAAQRAAAKDIIKALHVGSADAVARLHALARIPPADMAFLRSVGPQVRAGAAQLAAVSTVPPADLAYLQANGAKVATAQRITAGQWQGWWWVCFAGQVLFIPLGLFLAGRWSPRRARDDELRHEQLVQRELEALHSATGLAAGPASRLA